MATAAPITPIGHFNDAYALYGAAAGLRALAQTDDDVDAIAALIEPRFEAMLAAPARGLHDIADKAEAIIMEFGECDAIPTDTVMALLRDVRGMVQ